MAIGNVTGTLSYQWTGLVLAISGGVAQSWVCEVVQWVNLDVTEELLQRNWNTNLILQYVSSSWSVVAWWKVGTMTGHDKNLVAYCAILHYLVQEIDLLHYFTAKDATNTLLSTLGYKSL